jgi:5'-deoxynucleotidase YfbR-like HD superfamily hydrolase
MMMLVVHELEELVIGDLTPFSATTIEEKAELGREAVQKVLGNLTKKEEYLQLIEEFNQNETQEARFAKMCDKLEHNIQIKYYEEAGELDINNPKNAHNLQDPRIIKMREEGEKTITDFFINFSQHHFASSPLFQEISEFVKEKDLHSLGNQ